MTPREVTENVAALYGAETVVLSHLCYEVPVTVNFLSVLLA